MTFRPFRGNSALRTPHSALRTPSLSLRERLGEGRHPSSTPDHRRGVILLVVMVLLAIFTMLGLTLVLVTAQGRLSALAAARATVESEHSEQMLDNVLTQVVTGSTDPNSAIGAHGLLEDLYGLPQFFGQIYQVPTGLPLPIIPLGTVQQNFTNNPIQSGQLMQFTVSATQIPNPAVNPAPPGQFIHPLPLYKGAFGGQVITMLTGPAAGHSARVVGYDYDANIGLGTWAYLQTTSFDGLVPEIGDNFMINGRAFAGTGFGLDLTKFQTPGTGFPWVAPYTQPVYNPAGGPPIRGPLLTAVEAFGNTPSFMPYAYLPNHSRIGVSNFLLPTPGTYWDLSGPGGANEPYDAPDFQNMMLAMHVSSGANVVTPIPSLHRPELVGWFAQQAVATGNPAISMGNPAGGPAMLNTRRKVILRPEPTDNFFVDTNGNGVWDAREPFQDLDSSFGYSAGDTYLDLNGDGAWTPGETDYTGKTFNPVTGCWYITAGGAWALDPTLASGGLDVDNDQDGIVDSIWVDVGLQAQKESDGNYYKYLAAILCIDLDGKVNLNASGSLAQVDSFRYGGNSISGPFAGGAGVTTLYGGNGRNLVAGQGYGPADINLIKLFTRAQGNPVSAQRFYQIYLQGYNNPGVNQPLAPSPPLPPFKVSGRYGEVTRLTAPGSPFPGVYPAYSFPLVLTPPAGLSYTQQLFNGPRPGWSQWYDPFLTTLIGLNSVNATGTPTPFYWANDPTTLARLSDYRPDLLVPNNPLNAGTYFFSDFLGFLGGPTNHLATAHGTPSDLHSRGFLARDLSGHPYYAGTGTFPWQTMPAVWTSTMQDFAINQYLSIYPWLAGEVTLNEIVDSPYESNLNQNAAREGRNTGNSLNNVAGNDFSPIDDPLRPSEFEAILRSHEQAVTGPASTAGLGQRLIDQQTALNYANYLFTGGATVPPPATTTPLGNDNVRLAVTTESWDAPVPNMALTPQQYQDVTAYANYYGLPLLSLNNLSIADLARARIFVENYNGGVVNPNFPLLSPALPSAADLALFGNLKNVKQNVAVFPTLSPPVPPLAATANWPLLSPDLILGMRLDVNRLLGNGQDDNGNGVVDEPAEALAGEQMAYPMGNPPNQAGGQGPRPVNLITGMDVVTEWLDLNNDGFLSAAVTDPQTGNPNPLPALQQDPTFADTRARQLLARHLYVTMMLLLDDRSIPGGANATIAAQIFNASGAPMPPGWPNYAGMSSLTDGARRQAAYVIAQWAINVVDFRDRDSIMTPFEFDIYPFHADDPTNPMVTWNVDDIIDPSIGGPVPYSRLDDGQTWRGLVWGCERPELLITETVGFHDRGTANTNAAQAAAGNQDTYYDPNTGIGDTDFDQVRRPRGSLIVELFNPTSYWDAPQRDMQTSGLAPQPWASPDLNGNTGLGVNLAQVATGQPATGGPVSSPVWRLVVAYSPWLDESGFYTAASTSPYSPAGTAKTFDLRVPILPPTAIHRAVYFTPFQPGFVNGAGGAALASTSTVADALLNNSFFADPDIFTTAAAAGASPSTILVPPGQYALVGPANRDVAGSGNYYIYAGNNTPPTPPNTSQNNYPWMLQLGNVPTHNTTAYVYGAGGAIALTSPYYSVGGVGYNPLTSASTTIKPVIGVPIQTNWFKTAGGPVYVQHNSAGPTGVSAGSTVATTLRMSLSEPEHGYPVFPPGTALPQDDATYYTQPGSPASSSFPQHPFDSTSQSTNTGGATLQFGDKPNLYTASAAGDTTIYTAATQGGYTVLFLQRLANPLQAWDEKLNPYITVDSMPVDLTAYSGEPPQAGAPTVNNKPVADPIKGSNAGTASFDTRRRGYAAAGTPLLASQGTPNIWTPLPINMGNLYTTAGKFGNNSSGTCANPMPATGLGLPVGSSLGFVNWEYSAVGASSLFWTADAAPVGTSGLPSYLYNGDPTLPFPWLIWNNRPYISQYELMLVPASSPSSLLNDYGMLGWKSATVGTAVNEYAPGQPTALYLPVSQFEHLLNFFNNQQATTPVGTNTYLPNLYRIFEFLHVPSRFAGTQDLMNPTMFLGDNAVPVGSGLNTSHLFHPPFNWLSRYHDPGKINLNTVFDPIVFQSLADDYPGQTTLWLQLLNSRYGQVQTGQANPLLPNPLTLWGANATGLATLSVYPTYFANPFRPDGAGNLVPPTSMLYPTQSAMMHAWNYPGGGGIYNGVNATMLRSFGPSSFPSTPNPVATPPWTTPTTLGPLAMFDDSSFDGNNLNSAGKVTNVTSFRNAVTDPTFQYQMFTRLGNTTTNRSNVYAIWITLGKFEVQPIAVSSTNPDGYRLLRPALDANGNQEVQRGFYIFDRSIPMGFQRGQNTNIEKGILLERVLE